MEDSPKPGPKRAPSQETAEPLKERDETSCPDIEASEVALLRATALGDAVRRRLGGRIQFDWASTALDQAGLAGSPGAAPAVVRFRRRGSQDVLVSYVVAPWQSAAEWTAAVDTPVLGPSLLTVTKQALIFGPMPSSASSNAVELSAEIARAVRAAVDFDQLEASTTLAAAGPPPEGLQLISSESRRYYVTLVVALPGSRVPSDGELRRVAPRRMIRLILTPDRGPRRIRWIAPEACAATGPNEEASPTDSAH